MSKSLGNVVDPKSVIEGGKNQKVQSVLLSYLVSSLKVARLNPLDALLLFVSGRKPQAMEQMSCAFGFPVWTTPVM